eukprot:Nk52_evm73s207 gene=Nk52_evmTU73s207
MGLSVLSYTAFIVLLVSVYVEYQCWVLHFSPVPHERVPVREFKGIFEKNRHLEQSIVLAENLPSPESIAVDSKGNVVFSSAGSGILSFDKGNNVVEYAFYGPNRPLGIAFDQYGNLFVCDAHIGLLKISNTTKEVVILATKTEDGQNIHYANDLAVASNGKVYFSDASEFRPRLKHDRVTYDTFEGAVLEGLSGRESGRLLEYDPVTRKTRVLVKDVNFGNGVAISRDESFVLFADCFNRKVLKYWLKGKKANTLDTVVEGIPFYLDNFSRGESGNFYLALVSVTSPIVEFCQPYPYLKKLIAAAPSFLQPKEKSHSAVMVFDSEGNVKSTHHQQASGGLTSPTHAVERDGKLILGTIKGTKLYQLDMTHLKL